MSYLICPHCSERIDVFSHGGGRRTAETMGVNFLAELPLDPKIRVGGDSGAPVALLKDEGEPFMELARNTNRALRRGNAEGRAAHRDRRVRDAGPAQVRSKIVCQPISRCGRRKA